MIFLPMPAEPIHQIPSAAEQSLRDVVALSTLPAIWVGADPVRIAESLAAAVFTNLFPAFVYVMFEGCEGSARIAVAQTDRYETSPELADRVGDRVLGWARDHDPTELLQLTEPAGSSECLVTARALGLDAELGVIAAGFVPSAAPSPAHHLILNVAATQATSAIRTTRLLSSLRESERRERAAHAKLDERLKELEHTSRELERSKKEAIAARDNAIHSREAIAQSEERLRSLVVVITDIPWLADADGAFIEPQRRWEEYTGQSWEEHRGFGWVNAIHPDDRASVLEEWKAARRLGTLYESRGRVWHAGSARYRRFRVKAVPVRCARGAIQEWTGACTDVEHQEAAEEQLRHHREHLEQLVAQRTTELAESHQRLRFAERMASLGTLSAGLGHDMGNLLLPVRVRLDSLEAMRLPESAKEEVAGIRSAAQYLQKLASGLRLLAVDPARDGASSTDLAQWWEEAADVLRNSLPRGIGLESVLPAQPCLVGMSKAALTQAVFNLVQNAGEAMREWGSGLVSVRVRDGGSAVEIEVRDDGPGMTEEVCARCMEPFFSTKSREISTGLGLSLVHGLVRSARGTINVESAPGRGTTFTLRLPRAEVRGMRDRGRRRVACVDLRDARLRSIVCKELGLRSFAVLEGSERLGEADLVVTDRTDLNGDVRGRLLLVGEGSSRPPPDARLSASPRVAEIRDALAQLGLGAGRGTSRA